MQCALCRWFQVICEIQCGISVNGGVDATFQAVVHRHGDPAGAGGMVGIQPWRHGGPAAGIVDRGRAGRARSVAVLRQRGGERFRVAQLERVLAKAVPDGRYPGRRVRHAPAVPPADRLDGDRPRPARRLAHGDHQSGRVRPPPDFQACRGRGLRRRLPAAGLPELPVRRGKGTPLARLDRRKSRQVRQRRPGHPADPAGRVRLHAPGCRKPSSCRC
jgi:hypothetical protein